MTVDASAHQSGITERLWGGEEVIAFVELRVEDGAARTRRVGA